MRSATSTTASIGSSDTIFASSRPWNENAASPTSTMTSLITPLHGAATTPRSRSASAAASAASAVLSAASMLTSSSRGIAPVSMSLRLDSSSVRRWNTIDLPCATWAARASSESTARTSPSLTRVPRLILSSVTMPPVRAVMVPWRSASVRPEIVSLRLCGHEPHLDDGDAERLLGGLRCPGRGVALGACRGATGAPTRSTGRRRRRGLWR